MKRESYSHNFNFDGMPVKVEYYFEPSETETKNCPYPDEHYDITVVECGGVLINEFIDNMDLWDKLRDGLIKALEGQPV